MTLELIFLSSCAITLIFIAYLSHWKPSLEKRVWYVTVGALAGVAVSLLCYGMSDNWIKFLPVPIGTGLLGLSTCYRRIGAWFGLLITLAYITIAWGLVPSPFKAN